MPKPPQAVLDAVFAFSPNRDTLGATSYLIVENNANILIDTPAIDKENLEFLQQHGGVRWLFITHRGAIGKAAELSKILSCSVVIQEQEAYLLPEITVTKFEKELALNPRATAIWTPGHSPGSSCLYWSGCGGVLFTGRHLLPNKHGQPVPLRTSKTFHWWRQLRSVELLRERFTADTLNYILPGANIGFLRGKKVIDRGWELLASLDLQALRQAPVLL